MDKFTKISTQTLFVLKEALSFIYWQKKDLRFFLETTIKNNAIVNTFDWEKKEITKADIVNQLLTRMNDRDDIFRDDIFFLIHQTANVTDFSNLEKFENAKSTISKAKDAVNRLRNHSKGFFEKKEDLEKAQNAKIKKEEKIEKHLSFIQRLELFKQEFITISNNTNLQQRGFQLEVFLYDLFIFFQIPTVGSFKIQNQQIDGAFSFDGKEFLLEAKWTKQPIANKDIAPLLLNLQSKLKITLGLFISINGFVENCTAGAGNQIIFIDGNDLYKVLDNRQTLNELPLEKIKLAAQKGIFYAKK